MTVLSTANEWDLDNLSTEVSKGLMAMAKSAMWLGEVPFGYDFCYAKTIRKGMHPRSSLWSVVPQEQIGCPSSGFLVDLAF